MKTPIPKLGSQLLPGAGWWGALDQREKTGMMVAEIWDEEAGGCGFVESLGGRE